ncbi:MAG: hypothetical protein K8S23_05355 [Candidatus Cloacimonetes bacterium]|nr:hypothetical protein [Candidatus Cloacimonadota bacterium]
MMIKEDNKERIKEFFDLTDQSHKIRGYRKPVLVYDIYNDKVRYSLWEEELLNRYGLKNVDGWDYTEDAIFCPDWMQDEEDEDDFDDLDEDDL